MLGRLVDSNRDVRTSVVQLLATIAEEADIPAIEAHLKSEDRYARQGAASVLGGVAQRGDGRVISLLHKLLSDSQAHVREAAAEALGKLAVAGDERTASLLQPLADDADAHVREAAAEALHAIRGA